MTLVLQRCCHDVSLHEVSLQKVFHSLRNGAKQSYVQQSLRSRSTPDFLPNSHTGVVQKMS